MMRRQAHGTWVIIPAFNEASAIGAVVADVRRTGHAAVVVDDGSADGTAEVAARAGAILVRHPINLGQGAALQTGIEFALARGADLIITFDADGQHRASDIAGLLAALAAKRADFALGSRFLGGATGMPRSRRRLGKAAPVVTPRATGRSGADAHNGRRALPRRGASAIHLRQNRMAHASEILDHIASSGLAYVEVPVTVRYSAYSIGKGQRSSDMMAILLDLFARRLHR